MFYHLVGDNEMEQILKNHESIKELYQTYQKTNNLSSMISGEYSNNIIIHLYHLLISFSKILDVNLSSSSYAMDSDSLERAYEKSVGSFGNVSLVGNRIDVQVSILYQN